MPFPFGIVENGLAIVFIGIHGWGVPTSGFWTILRIAALPVVLMTTFQSLMTAVLRSLTTTVQTLIDGMVLPAHFSLQPLLQVAEYGLAWDFDRLSEATSMPPGICSIFARLVLGVAVCSACSPDRRGLHLRAGWRFSARSA
jgi:hypothetical protein